MTRKQYAYRLKVEYPSTPEYYTHGHLPVFMHGFDEEGRWRWPIVTTKLSLAAAKRRAHLLGEYGCTVVIERSHPITWPELTP